MKRILLRAGKDPFTAFSPENTLKHDILGTNSGNLIFALSAHKTLSTPNQTIDHFGYTAKKLIAKEINENYDCLVLPFANAFRISFKKTLNDFTDIISELKIPVIVLGVGVQASLDYDVSEIDEIKDDVKRFIDAVLKNSKSIGVRGECTAQYLKYLGYSDSEIDIIGCPSMFFHGDNLNIKEKSLNFSNDSKIAFNASPYVSGIDKIAENHYKNYKNICYIPQNNIDLEALLYGEFPKSKKKTNLYNISNPIYAANKTRFFIDPQPWMNFLSECDFSFGTRIHGNITSLLAGTPCHVLAHDSRTLELVRYFEIPHTLMSNLSTDIDAKDLFQKSNYTNLMKNHKTRFNTYKEFLAKHDLETIFDYENLPQEYDQQYFSANLSNAISPLSFTPQEDLVERIRWLKKDSTARIKKLTDQIKAK
jgi:hypothetical protein